MRELSCSESALEFSFIEFVPTHLAAPLPPLVYLHGSGERGDDLSVIKRFGLPALLSRGEVITNCVVICPQLETELKWEPGRVLRFLQAIKTRHSNIAIVGFSLGGSGVCDALARYGATLSPLAISIAGRSSCAVVTSQKGVGFLSIVGSLDPRPTLRPFVERIRAFGGAADEIVMPNHDHFISEHALWVPALQTLLRDRGFNLEHSEEAIAKQAASNRPPQV